MFRPDGARPADWFPGVSLPAVDRRLRRSGTPRPHCAGQTRSRQQLESGILRGAWPRTGSVEELPVREEFQGPLAAGRLLELPARVVGPPRTPFRIHNLAVPACLTAIGSMLKRV